MSELHERRLVAAYGNVDSADRMSELLADRGIAADAVRVNAVHDLAVVGRGKQRQEAHGIVVGIVPGPGRSDQLVSGWLWAIVGFAVGAVAFFVVGLFVPLGDLPRLAAAGIVAACGAVGGAAVGLVYGLSQGPVLADSGPDGPATSVISVRVETADDEVALAELLRTGPNPSVWVVPDDAVTGVDDPLTEGTSDHPNDAAARFGEPRPGGA